MGELQLKGYHGTRISSAHNILTSGVFQYSTTAKEWLGSGAYFYFEKMDAVSWNRANVPDWVILSVDVFVEEYDYLDLDTDRGKWLFCKLMRSIQERSPDKITSNAEENQCSVANMLWQTLDLKVISGSFAPERSPFRTLTDPRVRRREFCVRDMSCIRNVCLDKMV